MAAQMTARLRAPLAEVHDAESGRIDARRIADLMGVPLPHVAAAVGASYAAVHKTPDAPALQERLAPIKRALGLLARATRNRRDARAWLNSPHPDLGEKTPLRVMLDGHADAVVTLLENTLSGQPG